MDTLSTEHQLAVQTYQRYAKRLEILRAVDRAILTAQSLRDTAKAVLQNVQELIACQHASVFIFDVKQNSVIVVSVATEQATSLQEEQRLPLHFFETSAIKVPIYTPDMSLLADESSFLYQLYQEGLRSCVLIPLIFQGETLGILNLASIQPAAFDNEHLEIAQEMAGQLAIAINQTQLRERIQNYAAELEQRVKTRTAELYRAKERVEAILNSSSDAIILAHLDGSIQQVNPAFDRLFGYQQDEYFNLPLTVLVSADYIDTLKNAIDATIKDQQTRRMEVVATRKNGTAFVAEIAFSLIIDDESRVRGIVCSLRDITERKRFEAALRSSEARYRAVVEDQTELIFRYFEDGTLTFVNGAYCRFFESAPQKLLGRSFFSLMTANKIAAFRACIASLNIKNPVGNVEEEITTKDGRRWVYWTNRAIFDDEGRIIEYQAVGRDITEIKHAEIELRKALEKEKELVELKSRFIATTSHEFRTPLATIMATAASIQHYRHKMDNEQLEKRFQKITTQIQHLTSLIDDILTVERSQAKQIEFKPALVNVDAFCQEVVEEFQRRPDIQHYLIYNSELNGRLPETIVDQKLFRQIVTNMISNAIKYSAPGSIVAVSVAYEPDVITLRFRDEGIGIPPDDQSRLFEAFHRGTNVSTIAGTGLGLAIVRNAVDLHGGTITFESEVGKGTTFIISIPYRPDGDEPL